MIAIAVATVIALAMLYGVSSHGNVAYEGSARPGIICAEDRLYVSEKCDKVTEASSLFELRRFTAGEKLLCGVLRHGGMKVGKI